jgi:hypothetical protein
MTRIDEIQRRTHLREPALGYMEVKRGSPQVRMTHQALDHRQFHAAFNQMGGKRVAQYMNAPLRCTPLFWTARL